MVEFSTYPVGAVHETVAAFCQDNGIEDLDVLPRFRTETVAELAVFLDSRS